MALPEKHRASAEETRMKYLAVVVDDDAASRFIYDRVLRSMNFDVLQAGDGVTAVELLTRNTPDFLLIDLLLPRLSGIQVLEYAHEAPHLVAMQTVIITAHSDFKSTYTLSRNESFLVKPVTTHTLRELAQRVISSTPKTS
jgi:DNA-binding NtrC family response regulator